MLIEILLSGEPSASAAFAIAMRTHARRFGATVLAMDFPLMPEEATRVCEALDFLAALLVADVRPIVLVHVFPGRRVLVSK